MKALPPKKPTYEEQRKDWSAILNMCTQPSKRQGLKARIIRHESYRIGLIGIARPFNDTDYRKQYDAYCNQMQRLAKHGFKFGHEKSGACFDFFPIDSETGHVTVGHTHVGLNDIEFIEHQQLKIDL